MTSFRILELERFDQDFIFLHLDVLYGTKVKTLFNREDLKNL